LFSDPQSVTINAVAQSMPRIEVDGKKAIYQKADQTFTLTISHRSSKNKGRERISSVIRLDQRAIVADPLTSVSDYDTVSVWLVIDRPIYGFTVTQVQQLVAGFESYLDATAVSKVFGQES